MTKSFIWAEKYRPQTFDQIILPKRLLDPFKEIISSSKTVPNLILSGSPGIGKTSVARVLLNQLNCDYIVKNGSLDTNLDLLRTNLTEFASTLSFKKGRKFVLIDEADYMDPNHFQPALRKFMEDYTDSCGFIFTCNHPNKIVDAIQSRCSVIPFNVSKQELIEMGALFYKRAINILESEGVTFDKKVVAEAIKRTMPDWRSILNQLQWLAINGNIDNLSNLPQSNLDPLVEILRKKDFDAMRKWVVDNFNNDKTVYRKLYDSLDKYFVPQSKPEAILVLDRFQQSAAIVADLELNFAACLTTLMIECEFQ